MLQLDRKVRDDLGKGRGAVGKERWGEAVDRSQHPWTKSSVTVTGIHAMSMSLKPLQHTNS
jgi:hypothetical protein